MRLACIAQAHEKDVTVFASQKLSKRFLDMFIKVFKIANTGREIRKYAE